MFGLSHTFELRKYDPFMINRKEKTHITVVVLHNICLLFLCWCVNPHVRFAISKKSGDVYLFHFNFLDTCNSKQ